MEARNENSGPEKFSYNQGWAEVIGPHYSVEVNGATCNLIGFLRKSFADGMIPVLIGRKQIGKTHILKPHLEASFEDLIVLEVGGNELEKLRTRPKNMVIFGSLARSGSEEERQNQIDNQIMHICKSNNLFTKDMLLAGIVKLVVTGENVDEMMGFLGVLDLKKRHKHQIVKAFRSEYKPVRGGVEAIKKCLGNKLPVSLR